jgi:hypothetical protein
VFFGKVAIVLYMKHGFLCGTNMHSNCASELINARQLGICGNERRKAGFMGETQDGKARAKLAL